MSIKPRSEKDSQTNHEDRHISYNPRVQHRRPTSAYTLEGLLSLPTRLLHPPPLPMRSSATKIDSVVKEERGTSSTSLRKWWPRSPSGLVCSFLVFSLFFCSQWRNRRVYWMHVLRKPMFIFLHAQSGWIIRCASKPSFFTSLGARLWRFLGLRRTFAWESLLLLLDWSLYQTIYSRKQTFENSGF